MNEKRSSGRENAAFGLYSFRQTWESQICIISSEIEVRKTRKEQYPDSIKNSPERALQTQEPVGTARHIGHLVKIVQD